MLAICIAAFLNFISKNAYYSEKSDLLNTEKRTFK